MEILINITYYCGKFIFATILFVAMVVSTIVSLPFIGAGMIKDAMSSQHQHHQKNILDIYG